MATSPASRRSMWCSSGATKEGDFGVESWLLRTLTVGARIQPQAISPRLLVVQLDGPRCSFTHVVAHSPIQQAPAEERSTFWNALRDALLAVPTRRKVFLSIDGNATLGCVESIATPVIDGVVENNNGASLREVMEETAMVLSSMATSRVLPTWFGGLLPHEGRRIDYVAASADVADGCMCAGVDHEIHLSGKDSIDHLLTYAEFTLPPEGRSKGSRSRPTTARLSRAAMEDPEIQHRFQSILWDNLARVLAGPNDPEALHDRVVSLMRNAQEACFVVDDPPDAPRRPWTSPATAQLASATPALRSNLHRRRRALRQQTLTCLWARWCSGLAASARQDQRLARAARM